MWQLVPTSDTVLALYIYMSWVYGQRSLLNLYILSMAVTCDPPCQQGAPCVNTDVCNCPVNYHGERCELGTDNDPITDHVISYLIRSYFLYFLAPSDVDECALGLHNCDHICNNTQGGFSCSCQDGFLLYLDEASCTGNIEVLSFLAEVSVLSSFIPQTLMNVLRGPTTVITTATILLEDSCVTAKMVIFYTQTSTLVEVSVYCSHQTHFGCL